MTQDPGDDSTAPGGRALIVIAAFFVVCAGIRESAVILIPVLAALFIAAVAMGPFLALRKRGAPLWLAASIVLLLVLAALLVAGVIGADAVASFGQSLPSYTAILDQQVTAVNAWLRAHSVNISSGSITDIMNPAQMMGVLTTTLGAMVSVLRDGLFVFLTTCFILAEAASLPAKLTLAFGVGDQGLLPWRKALSDMSSYLLVKSQTSLATAILVAISLWLLDIPYALALGVLAFALNFIPVFGAILAGVPAVLLALVLHGAGHATVAAAVYTAINVVIGNVVEPRMMGQRLGLSTLVVFLSLVFWGFLLGPVGMLLAVPLTMLAKIVMDHTRDLRWLAVLLGAAPKAPQ